MAERPYVNKSIQDLEALFRKAGEAAPLLQALQYELSFRKTQRAKSLLKSISEQLGQTNTNSQSAKPTSQSSPAAQSNSGDAPSVQLKQKNCLQEFISALNLEAEAIKQQSRERAISVHNGELIEFSEGMYLYQFVLDEDVYLRDDAPLVVEFGDKEVNGNVASVKDKSIKIFIEENLGPHIAYAQIKTNDSFLVERLKERLESLGKSDTEISVNMQGFYRSLGLEQTKVGSAENEFVEVSSLNDEQQQALRVSKGSDLLFLWGPPGTGKTHALAKIIEEFYRADKRVLLTSNTNLAVDTLLQKLCEALVESSEPGFLQGSVIRHGTIVKEELQSEFSSYVSVNEVVERVSASLVSEREGLLDEEEKLLDYAEQCAKIISAFNMIPDTQAKLMQTRQQLEAFKSELEKRKQQKIDLDEKRDALEQQFEEIEGWGFVKKALYGSKETRVRTELEQTKKRFLEVSTQILEAPLRKAELREAIPKLEHQINVLNRLTQGKEKAAIESEHEGTQIKIDDIKDRLAEIADELANIKEKVKQNCKVLAATATQVYLKPDEFKDFDVVVVDEASMLILPLAAYAASLGRAKAIIAGDFRQLSPIVTSRDKVVQALLGKDIFEQAGIARAVAQGQAPAHLVKLNTQYRMAKDICDLINMPFYGGTLKTGRGAVANYPSKLLASNVQIIDTSSLVPFVNLRPGTYSRYNVLHALAIRNIVQLLTAENILDQNRSLGVVSPYKEQAKFVGKLFSELGMDSIACGTVHSYQGNEKHIIIYDIADSFGLPYTSKFISATELQDDGAKLLNVALSRARDKVLIFANLDYLLKKLAKHTYVRAMLESIVMRGLVKDVNDVIDLSALNSSFLYKNQQFDFSYDPSRMHFFSEARFDKALTQDLSHVMKSVVIFSAFITPRGAAKWANIFRDLISRGVIVRIITRPPNAQGNIPANSVREAIYPLVQLGVLVDLRAAMHEKHVMIDDQVLWTGSLNVLSHTGKTDESMLRITSKSAIEQLAELESHVKWIRKGENVVDFLIAKENPDCPSCESLSVYHPKGKWGPFFDCEADECSWGVSVENVRRGKLSPKKGSQQSKNDSQKNRERHGEANSCPECGKELELRNGRFGEFWGCTGFPKCKYTMNA